MATYQNITQEEIRKFLDKQKGWHEETGGQAKELVFQYPLVKFPHILVKVYTGIKNDSGQSRKCGKDAIRVCAINTKTDKGFIKSKRVHRVAGWKNNLRERVISVIRDANSRASLFSNSDLPINKIKKIV